MKIENKLCLLKQLSVIFLLSWQIKLAESSFPPLLAIKWMIFMAYFDVFVNVILYFD